MQNRIQNFLADYIRVNQLSALIRFGLSMLISIILVHSFYTKQEVGQFEFGLLLAYTCTFFLAFGYSSAILSRVGELAKEHWDISLVQIRGQLLTLGIILGFGVYSFWNYATYFGFNLIVEYRLPVSLLIPFLLVGIMPEVYLILNKKAHGLLYLNIGTLGSLLLYTGIIIYWRLPIYYVLWGYVFMHFVRFLCSIFQLGIQFSWDWLEQKSWFYFSLPIIGHFFLGSSMDYIDGHLVAYYFDDISFLYYRYGAKELPLSLMMISALSAAVIAPLAQDIAFLKELKARIARLIKLLYPISILLMFLSPLLFKWVYGPGFEQAALIFNIYLLILTSRILVPQLILYAKQANVALLWFSAFELVANICLSLYFLNIWGMYGIALASVIAFILNRIGLIIYVRQKYQIALSEYVPVNIYLLCSVALWITFYCSYLLYF